MRAFLIFSLMVMGFTTSVEAKPPLKLTSPSGFYHNAMIPLRFTCNGKKISPPLKWRGVPSETKTFAIICEDSDTPNGQGKDHWILYNIPGDTREISEGAYDLPKEARQGLNSWGQTEYSAPCPPDREHRYVFKLYALNKELTLDHAPTKNELLKAMEGHILTQTELVGRYTQPQDR